MNYFNIKNLVKTTVTVLLVVMSVACSHSNNSNTSRYAVQENYVDKAANQWKLSLKSQGYVPSGLVKALGARYSDSVRLTSTTISNGKEKVGVEFEKESYKPLQITIIPIKIQFDSDVFIADDSIYHKVTTAIAKLIEGINTRKLNKVTFRITGFADSPRYSKDAVLAKLFDNWPEYNLQDDVKMISVDSGQRIANRYYVGMPMNNAVLAQLRAIGALRNIRKQFGEVMAQFINYELSYKVWENKVGSQYRGVTIIIETNQ